MHALRNALWTAGAPHWRNELLSVRSADGQRVGAIERGAVRILGVRTEAVHLVGYAAQGIWLQQRAMSKADDPGKWDTLSGGTVADRESTAQAMQRETLEEAGLALDDLTELEHGGTLSIEQSTDAGMGLRREMLHWYTARLPEALEPRNLDGEVMAFKCVDRAELQRLIAENMLSADAAEIFQAALKQGLV